LGFAAHRSAAVVVMRPGFVKAQRRSGRPGGVKIGATNLGVVEEVEKWQLQAAVHSVKRP
jgi:hypothetical protein